MELQHSTVLVTGNTDPGVMDSHGDRCLDDVGRTEVGV
jgi:hypothetical protein